MDSGPHGDALGVLGTQRPALRHLPEERSVSAPRARYLAKLERSGRPGPRASDGLAVPSLDRGALPHPNANRDR
ncbi:MAG: hypothetical protein OXG19_04870 [Chloroflexi bacterium]|nr:hypothetical protein [Chloroflexota bacterium]